MPELKNFTQGDFNEAFSGSASDLFKTPIAPRAQPAVNPAIAQPLINPVVATPVPAAAAPVPDQDANNLINNPIDPKAAAPVVQKTEEEIEAEKKKAELEGANPDPNKAKPGRPVAEKIDEPTQKLFTKLISEGKLFGFTDGKIETQRDVEELLEANVTHKNDQLRQETIQGAIATLNPAMQAVLGYAQYVQDPSELVPFLTANANVQQISTLDETKPVDQERIVRERMKLNGDSEELIATEIQDLKDRDKLAERAKTYKPHLTQYYERQAQQLLQQRQQEEQEYIQTVQKNDQNIRKILDAPEFDGVKLKQAHKGIVYELLAVPREQYGGGVGIYSVIDNLFMEGKFSTLAKIALLAGDEKAFEELISTKARMKAADTTIRTLNTTTRTGAPIVTDPDEPTPANTLPRPTQSRGGFGFGNSR